MIKWVVAFAALVIVLGVLVFQLSASQPIAVPALDEAQDPIVATPAAPAPAPSPRAKTEKAKPLIKSKAVEDLQAAKLDPQSEAFSHQVDVGIPDGFRAKLARCNRSGMDPDAKITLSYQLHIEEGVVSASQVKIDKSDLGDAALESCMVNAVDQARWVATDMPDFSEEQELFIRIRSLNKYLDDDEQEAVKAADSTKD